LNARDFSLYAHGKQTYGGHPFIVHLDAVAAVLREAGFSGPIMDAAYLHDSLEDSPVTMEEIETFFGQEVGELVWAVTGVGETRKERNASIYQKLAACKSARDLKAADRIANLEAQGSGNLRATYVREHEEFLAAIYGAHPALLARLAQAMAL
jgi:(p)ppGpp synthase/HD superfamily hydrolase